jgi:hypothetical protein
MGSAQRRGYLYRHIRSDKNEVFYIGIGVDTKSKYRRAFMNYSRNKFWNNITNKTGYVVEIVLKDLEYNVLLEKEKEFIKLYGRRDLGLGTLVNLTDGGEGTLGCKANLGKKRSLETKLKMRGRVRSEEHKLKISKANKGRQKTPEQLLKASQVRIGKKHSKPHSSRRKKILQKTLSGDIVKVWDCASDCEPHGFRRSTINECCHLKHKSHKGFIWEFYDDLMVLPNVDILATPEFT